MSYFIYLLISFFFTWLLVSPFQYLGKHYYCFPIPQKGAPEYRKKVPYLGGGPLYFGFILTLLCFFFWKIDSIELAINISNNKLPGILIGAALISFIGLVHDIYMTPVWLRILGQIIAATLLIITRVHTEVISLNIGAFHIAGQTFYCGNVLLTIAWVLLVVNIIDILEIFDGIIVGIALIVTLFLFAISTLGHDYFNAFLSLSFAGTLLGIISEQIHPPQILLGKMGSGFIGFMLATLTLNIEYSQNNSLAVIIPLLLLILPFLIIFTLFLRKQGSKAKKVSVNEFYQAIKKSKVKPASLMTGALIVTALSGVIAMCLFMFSSYILSISLLIFPIICSALVIKKLYDYGTA